MRGANNLKLDLEQRFTDILIIGAGGAAAMAALSAVELGAEVAIVSKETSLVGGATIQSSGGISSLLNANDSPDIYYNDIITGGRNLNNSKLVTILAERAKLALTKLEQFDFALDRVNPETFRNVRRSEGHSWPRDYLDRRESTGFCHALNRALIYKKVSFYPETLIFKILLNDTQVIGAIGFDICTGIYLVFNAKAVILATGGLGQLYKVTTNARTLTGDGFALAWDVGAQLIDMEMVQFLPLALPYPKSCKGVLIGICSAWGPKVKLYNGLGRRYMIAYDADKMEYTTRDIASRANFTEIMEGRGTENGTIVVDPTENDPTLLSVYEESLPYIYGRVRKVFGMDAANWKKPFEAIPSQHFFMGGTLVDEACKTSVPGLFAVGEVAGGIHGANRLSSTALTEVIVFGNLVGEKVVQWIKQKKLIPPNKREIKEEIDKLEDLFKPKDIDGIRPFEIKEMVKQLMWNYLGPVRNRECIKKAIESLISIRENALPHISLRSNHCRYNRERVELCEVNLMVKTALFIGYSALHREESRGSHYRNDFPSLNNKEWSRNIIVENKKSEIIITYKQVS